MAKECSNTSCSKESCEGCPSKQPKSMLEEMNSQSNVKHVIGIVSGKGGVGKSFVTASLANRMAQKGYKVGILDADITGPSIPKMYGVKGPAQAVDAGIYPIEAKNGWTDVIWGDLDYLFVDMPPGTGDVPLTVFQSLPVEGIVIVSSPQDLVKMIVRKAYKMAQMMKINVLGVVENYSYLVCPDCGKHISVFGESHIDEIVAELGTEVLGKMPINPLYAEAADKGAFHAVENEYLDKAVEKIVG